LGIKKIESNQELNQLSSETESLFLFKNSTTCPISSEALSEMEKYADSDPSIPIYYLNVQDSRELSNQISKNFGVKHETPQVLFINKKEVTWHTSHWKVTKKNVEKAVEGV
jgi:bacillithiol system protein YtxJ